jgi:D-alanyl-D-alanine carboxypeptidase
MTTFRTASVSIIVALSSILTACTSNDGDDTSDDPSSEGALDGKAIAEIEALADNAIIAGIPGLSLAVVRGKQTITIARGVSDRSTGDALSPAHRLRAASVAKSLVSSVVLQLVEEGALKLTDTLDTWLPGMLPAHGAVTVELLLRQESGIFDFASDERYMAPYLQGDLEYAWTPQTLVGLSAGHPPTFPPRARFEYSNTNYVLLGLIVERITGDPLATVVQKRITEPLGMKSSTMETTSALPSPFAHGYLVGMGDPIDVTHISASSVFGCGNLVSTPLDMAVFYKSLVRGDVVAKDQLSSMFATDPAVPATKYGMGVFRFDHDKFLPCGDFVGHDGGIPGYDTVAYSSIDGRRQFALVVTSFTMDEKAGDEAAHKAFGDLVDAIGCK